MLYKRVLIGIEAYKDLLFKMKIGNLKVRGRRSNKVACDHQVVEMAIDALLMKYCFGVPLVAGGHVNVIGNQVVEIGLGQAAHNEQRE